MGVADLFSALAANRKQFFDLVDAAEKRFDCRIDDLELQAEIDSGYSGRDSLNEREARDLLMKVSKAKPAPAMAVAE